MEPWRIIGQNFSDRKSDQFKVKRKYRREFGKKYNFCTFNNTYDVRIYLSVLFVCGCDYLILEVLKFPLFRLESFRAANGLIILPGATKDKKEAEAGTEVDALVIGTLLADFS